MTEISRYVSTEQFSEKSFGIVLALPSKLWFMFGLLIGSIVAPIVITLVYFVTVVPTGLIMRVLGKDLLKHRIDKDAKSYWIERKEPMGSMKNQF